MGKLNGEHEDWSLYEVPGGKLNGEHEDWSLYEVPGGKTEW